MTAPDDIDALQRDDEWFAEFTRAQEAEPPVLPRSLNRHFYDPDEYDPEVDDV